MASDRWNYQVVDVKPGFMGRSRDAIQEKLVQLGRRRLQRAYEAFAAKQSPVFEGD